MDAAPFLAEVGRHLNAIRLEAVLIGNAAAPLQGAPVMAIDFDFLFRKTPRNLAKLKKPPSRRAQLAALRRENERALIEMIRRWQALPPGRRTNFLRVRVAPGRTAL